MRPATTAETDDLQLRLLSLDCNPDELLRLKGFLDEHELKRGNRLLDRVRRDRFFAGRGMLREMLAGFLKVAPGKIDLCEGEFGKLQLADPSLSEEVSFNISHAGEKLLLAFVSGCEVGVDLEEIREELPFAAMAARYFSPREKSELFGLPPGERIGAFYRCWTRKEAYLKGTGSGFSEPSDGFDVSLLPQEPPALLAHRRSPEEVGRWQLRDVPVPAGYCAAVALRRR